MDPRENTIPNDIVFFWYTYSPYARKVGWYLELRGIAHANCFQPPIMPRPDLDALNISYRRIPVLAIGRDIYCDTRLIIRKLESMFPNGALGAQDPEHRAMEKLLERWTGDAGIFSNAVALIPTNLPNMKDPVFRKDRANFSGAMMNLEDMERRRPEALVRIRDAFQLMESTLLADGRTWIFKTEKPSLGDIEAVWPLHWLTTMPNALDTSYISATQFPRTFAYIARFYAALKTARAVAPKPRIVSGPQVIGKLSTAQFHDSIVGEFDANEPTDVKPGDMVTVWPTDTGTKHRDTGKVVAMTPEEVVLEKKTKMGNIIIRLHFPRWGYRVTKAKEKGNM